MKKKFLIVNLIVALVLVLSFGLSACGNSMFESDAEMQVTVRGAYAALDEISKNRGEFIIVEDTKVCQVSVFNGLLGQESDPIYTVMPIDFSIKKRNYQKGEIETETTKYAYQDNTSISITSDDYTYTKINEVGKILLSNSEQFSVENIEVKNSVWNTKTYSGNLISSITSKAVLLRFYFYDENYTSVSETEYFYFYQISKNSTAQFKVEIGKNVNTSNCVIMAYYI